MRIDTSLAGELIEGQDPPKILSRAVSVIEATSEAPVPG